MKFAQLRTKDDMTLDHLEWPPQGDFQLFAIDYSGFYGNYCLRLTSRRWPLRSTRSMRTGPTAHGS